MDDVLKIALVKEPIAISEDATNSLTAFEGVLEGEKQPTVM
jgi:hypothetical protein